MGTAWAAGAVKPSQPANAATIAIQPVLRTFIRSSCKKTNEKKRTTAPAADECGRRSSSARCSSMEIDARPRIIYRETAGSFWARGGIMGIGGMACNQKDHMAEMTYDSGHGT